MFSYKPLKALSTIKICSYSSPTWSNSARIAVIFSQYRQQNRFHVNSVGNPRRVSDTNTTNLETFSEFLFHWRFMTLRYNTYWCPNIFINQFPFQTSDQTTFQDPGCLTKGSWRRSYNRHGMSPVLEFQSYLDWGSASERRRREYYLLLLHKMQTQVCCIQNAPAPCSPTFLIFGSRWQENNWMVPLYHCRSDQLQDEAISMLYTEYSVPSS